MKNFLIEMVDRHPMRFLTIIKSKHPNVYNQLQSEYGHCDSEKIYSVIHGTRGNKCVQCKNKYTTYTGITNGYKQFCSNSCSTRFRNLSKTQLQRFLDYSNKHYNINETMFEIIMPEIRSYFDNNDFKVSLGKNICLVILNRSLSEIKTDFEIIISELSSLGKGVKYRRYEIIYGKENAYIKYRQALESHNIVKYEEMNKFNQYKTQVWNLTNSQPISDLKNYELRGHVKHEGYHLDHKFSVYEGFKNNIPPEKIANIKNLQMIPAKENISKGTKCSIAIDEVLSF